VETDASVYAVEWSSMARPRSSAVRDASIGEVRDPNQAKSQARHACYS